MGWFLDLFRRKKKVNESSVVKVSPLDGKSVTGASNKKGMVTAGTLNARQTPDKNGKILFKLKKHTVVTLTGLVGDWYQVTTELGVAYCMKEYIEIQETIEKILVNAKVLNVRSFYSTDASILGKAYSGNIFVKLNKHGNWYGISFNGKTGYVCGDYVTLLNDTASGSSQKNNSNSQNTKKDTTVSKQEDSRVFFNTRKDLAKVDLAPKKLLSADGLDKYGKVAVKTWNNYGNLISVISKELGIEVERALAVICVESGGNGFASDGKMLIRFENHVFHTYWGSKSDDNQSKYNEHFTFDAKNRRNDHKYRAKKSDEWKTGHAGQASEWEALEIARKLSDTQALYSISMGAPQVMGFNYKMIGYSSVNDMFEAFSKDIRYHIMALFDFCTAKSTRVQYLITGDFLSFAKEYNGLTAPEQYEARLVQYYDIYKKILK
ncbi:MAG: N-acetylmuramidase domain-containing protein [Bacteroidales bacterium]|nr:N-acetylmuramidase domain-containing protein [Bacteroidales bacterium]